MLMPTNFLGLRGVLENIEQGTLMALNNSLGFYHGHKMWVRSNMQINQGGEPDILLLNPIEDFNRSAFPGLHKFYVFGAELSLFGLEQVSLPVVGDLSGDFVYRGKKWGFGARVASRDDEQPYHVATGYKDICTQFEGYRVPPGYETVVASLEHYLLEDDRLARLRDEDEDSGPRDILIFPG